MYVARRIIRMVLLIQIGWMATVGVGLGLTMNLGFLYGFGGGALAVLAVLLSFMLVWQRVDARREALLATGVRVPALLVSSRRTGTQVNDRVVQAHTFEHRDAGRVVRAVAKAFTHLAVGTEATIAYDRADPSKAVVVEDLDQIAAGGQLDWQTLRQQQIDRTFRDRS